MRFKVVVTAVFAALAFAAVGGGFAASHSASAGSCAGGAESVSVNVGTGKLLNLPCKNMKVGYFAFGSGNAWLQVLQKVVKAKAAQYGWTVKIYDAAYDPAKQLNQIQNAIQRDHLNAAVIIPISGTLECKAVTKDLPAAGIVTVVHTDPICGNEVKAAGNSWAPGILTFVGSTDNVPFNAAWIRAGAKTNPGPQNVALILGPQIVAQAIAITKALSVLKAYPNFHITHTIYTDYTTATTLQKMRALLKADPNITLVMSCFSPDQTRGVLQALQEVGKLGKIPVGDIGASKWTYDQIKKGNIQYTIPLQPNLTAAYSMDALKNVLDGKKVPRGIIDLTTSESNPLVLTQKNLSTFKPTF